METAISLGIKSPNSLEVSVFRGDGHPSLIHETLRFRCFQLFHQQHEGLHLSWH